MRKSVTASSIAPPPLLLGATPVRAMGHGVDGHAKAGILDIETAREVAETMHALSTPSRVRILARLREGACSVTELAESGDGGIGGLASAARAPSSASGRG